MVTIPGVRIHFSQEDREEILCRIDEALVAGQLCLGKHGREFEAEFAKVIGTRFAIAVNSGTSAIEIPLRVWQVEGKEVIVPANTFFATVLAVLHAGGIPRFVDINPGTLGADAKKVAAAIGPHTAGVIVVHIGGIISPEIAAIRDLCRRRGLFLFEDAAHAHGSSLGGISAGRFGDTASFSLYATKVITSGEGGMIVTDDEVMREYALIYRDQGKAKVTANIHNKLGYNWRMSELHAIVGVVHLRRLGEFVAERQRLAHMYDHGLAALSRVRPLSVPEGCMSNYYKYIAVLEDGVDRGRLKEVVRERYGVALSGEVYELPCHLQPVFNGRYRPGDFPQAEAFCQRHICLPLFPGMRDHEVEYVIDSLGKVTGTM